MLIQTESKAQGWRAVAVFDDRPDALIFVGRSSTQVRQEYAGAFLELLDDEEREHVTTVQLQQWSGAPDAGRWVLKNTLKTPAPAGGTFGIPPHVTGLASGHRETNND